MYNPYSPYSIGSVTHEYNPYDTHSITTTGYNVPTTKCDTTK